MSKAKKCFICRAENLWTEFDRNRQQGTLTLFRVTVDRAVDAMAEDVSYFYKQACRHASERFTELRRELRVLQSQASARQDVRVVVGRR